MQKALTSLMRINTMKRQTTEQKLQDIQYKKTKIQNDIDKVKVIMLEAEKSVYENPQGPHPHMDVLNVLEWTSIQAKRIKIFEMAIGDLDKQQGVLKKEMCQLIIQKQTFETALSREKKARTLAQDKVRDEANNAIWLQRNLFASKY